MTKLKPKDATLAGIRALVPIYRNAVPKYDALLREARKEGKKAKSNGEPKDILNAWALLASSLKERREGMAFFATIFAKPKAFYSSPEYTKALAQVQRMKQRDDELNGRILSTFTTLYESRGFERRADGQFVLSCNN